MSKRGAEEYITKEHGSTLNTSSEGNKVKMATAAQLAKRKIATPKTRTGRTGTSPMPSSAPSNPFTSTNTFAAPQNNQQPIFPNSGGFTFGASQSFPPSDTSSNGGINFSVPGQSTSFTFGQPVQNNPFTGLNGSANSTSPPRQESSDITMESPQKKPAFGSGLFGSDSNENTTRSTGLTFGQPTNQPPSQPTFSFGQSQGFGGAAGTSLFGQNASNPSESSSNSIFGKNAQTQNNASAEGTSTFGQSTAAPQQQASSSGFKFGQSTASTSSSMPAFSFGQSAASAPSAVPAFSFGQPSTQANTGNTLFAASSPSSTPAFGTSTATSQPTSSASLLGSTSATSANNVFGGFGSSKPADFASSTEAAPASEQPKRPMFGQTTPNSVQDQAKSTADDSTGAGQDPPKTNPFAGLFASTSQQLNGSAPASSDVSKPLFNFAAPSQPTGLFSLPKTTEETSSHQSEDIAKKPRFSFETPSNASGTNLFSPSKSTTEPSPSTNSFAGGSFSKPQFTAEQRTDQPLFGSAKETPKKNDTPFQSLPPFGTSSTKSTLPDDSKSKPFSGFGITQPSAHTSTQNKTLDDQDLQKQNKSSLAPVSGQPTPARPADMLSSTPDLFTATAKAAATTSPATNAVHEKPKSTDEDPKWSINTHPPSRIPPYLNGDDYKSYDSNYRLHSLNREFQKRIASLDPSMEDFENIVRNYVAARESIGESIGLYTRNVAGMKRKADEENNHHEDGFSSAKRNKQIDTATTKPVLGSSQATSAVFQPVPTPSSTPSTMFTNRASTLTSTSTPSNADTSSLFSSMIPDKSGSTGVPGSNPFANFPKSNASNSGGNATKPAFSVGFSNSSSAPVGSTTPTKSPPKKPAFEMPKFVPPAGGMNFADAFKQQSEERAAKAAKEAKAKRKAEEFDSDEDDEEEWERKYEEEERAKKAKIGQVAQTGFKPTFGNGTVSSNKLTSSSDISSTTAMTAAKPTTGALFGNQNLERPSDKLTDTSENDASGEDEEEEGSEESGNGDEDDEEGEDEAEDDDLPEDDVEAEAEDDNDDDIETAMANSRAKGRSLFDRVTPNPNLQKDTAPKTNIVESVEKTSPKKPASFGNVFGKGTAETPSFSPLTLSGSKDPYVPSKTFNFTPTPPVTSPTPTVGASIFAGGIMRDGPIAGEGLFGSRPSTPSNAEKPKANAFGNLGTPSTTFGTDNTWKKGSEIKFGSSTLEAPSLSITAPSPRKDESKPFASLFGATSSAASNASSAPTLGFGFGQSPVPGFLAAASHLAGGSGTNSGLSSRATSPGTTDNESVATNEEDFSHDTQVSLMETNPGEENEDVIFETRARAMRYYNDEQIKGTKLEKGWNGVGLGNARLLKHRETGKTRLVMRAEPGANIILNTNLQPEVKYESTTQGSAGLVKFQVFTESGPQGWTLKVKSQQQGQDLAKAMEANKKPST